MAACQLGLRLGEELAGHAIDWQGNAPCDLPPELISRAAALMLVDMPQRSALGWPAQLLRAPLHAWPGVLGRMLRRRRLRGRQTVPGAAPVRQMSPGWRVALRQMLAPYGRARLADSLVVSRWLYRGS